MWCVCVAFAIVKRTNKQQQTLDIIAKCCEYKNTALVLVVCFSKKEKSSQTILLASRFVFFQVRKAGDEMSRKSHIAKPQPTHQSWRRDVTEKVSHSIRASTSDWRRDVTEKPYRKTVARTAFLHFEPPPLRKSKKHHCGVFFNISLIVG